MTALTLRKKMHQYIDKADESLLSAIYQLFEVYENSNGSCLSETQIKELNKRHKDFEDGKVETLSWEEVKRNVRKKMKKTK